ncbi:hypothetical protein MKA31_16985 [[Clostridium] innocuum]|nr:hypothetical protein [[Clostridium] innocuum]
MNNIGSESPILGFFLCMAASYFVGTYTKCLYTQKSNANAMDKPESGSALVKRLTVCYKISPVTAF